MGKLFHQKEAYNGRRRQNRAHFLLNGMQRTFTNVAIDTNAEGWLYITRLEVHEASISGIVEPIAGFRLAALVGWEYAEAE